MKVIEAREGAIVTGVQVPCEAPELYVSTYGNAPITQGKFLVRLTDGRMLTQ